MGTPKTWLSQRWENLNLHFGPKLFLIDIDANNQYLGRRDIGGVEVSQAWELEGTMGKEKVQEEEKEEEEASMS